MRQVLSVAFKGFSDFLIIRDGIDLSHQLWWGKSMQFKLINF
jgi:hypothetical protein